MSAPVASSSAPSSKGGPHAAKHGLSKTVRETLAVRRSHAPAGAGTKKVRDAIRGLERLLQKKGAQMDATGREQIESRIRALQEELATKEQSARMTKLEARYKHVRFFERQKVTRRIGQLKGKLARLLIDADAPPAREEALLRNALADNEEDLIYIDTFPGDQKYMSILQVSTDASVEARKRALRTELLRKAGYARPTLRMESDQPIPFQGIRRGAGTADEGGAGAADEAVGDDSEAEEGMEAEEEEEEEHKEEEVKEDEKDEEDEKEAPKPVKSKTLKEDSTSRAAALVSSKPGKRKSREAPPAPVPAAVSEVASAAKEPAAESNGQSKGGKKAAAAAAAVAAVITAEEPKVEAAKLAQSQGGKKKTKR